MMATQTTKTEQTSFEPGWSSFSGRVLEGGFELQEILEADEEHARLKVRVLGDRELDCVALLYRLDSNLAEAQKSIWAAARQLRHPNLSVPMGFGQIELEGNLAVYVVVRRGDESLGGVLRERALTVEEAGEALQSVARALEDLHLSGFAYGCLSPSQILAIGQSIQLPTACLRVAGQQPIVDVETPKYHAPESSGNLTPAADLWCLGATLFEALTQKTWSEGSQEQAGALPEPFASIVLRCLHTDPEGRATLSEVIALHKGELKVVPRSRAAVAGSSTSLVVPATDIAPAEPEAKSDVSRLTVALTQQVADASAHMNGIQAYVAEPATELRTPAEEVSAKQDSTTPVVPVAAVETVAGKLPVDRSAAKLNTDAPPVDATMQETRAPKNDFDEALRPALVARPQWNESSRAISDDDGPAANMWIWAGVALLVVLGLIWVLRPKTPAAKTGRATATTVPSAKPGSNAWETRTLQPDGSASKPAAAVPVNPAAAVPVNKAPSVQKAAPLKNESVNKTASETANTPPGSAVWRVILYTYAKQGDAEKKAQAINARFGAMHAAVFSPSGSGKPYLVTAGGRMTRDEANQLRRRVVGQGMPRDSYIQNYKQ